MIIEIGSKFLITLNIDLDETLLLLYISLFFLITLKESIGNAINDKKPLWDKIDY